MCRNLREVEYWDGYGESRAHKGLASFHTWGVEYDDFESGPGNFTVAIIELPNGEIMTVLPENIKFKTPLKSVMWGSISSNASHLCDTEDTFLNTQAPSTEDAESFLNLLNK